MLKNGQTGKPVYYGGIKMSENSLIVFEVVRCCSTGVCDP